jgi:hypothetical protein
VIAFLPQLGRKRLLLEASKASETRIAASHTIHALKLRGHATRLGFDRGPTGDGGYVDSFEQRLPSLGMTMVIVHAPVQLGDEKHDTTLEGIQFHRSEQHEPLALGQVPKVLLNEGWNVLLALMA